METQKPTTATATKATARSRGKGSGKIFISYRREDADESAGRIRDWLTQQRRVPPGNLFMDVHDVRPGVNFIQAVEQAIKQCKAMIVVIGPGWFIGPKSPSHYVHEEIKLALANKLQIIPVLVRGAVMPTADQLPDDIRDLAFYNARKVRADDDFDNDMKRLATALGVRFSSNPFVGVGSAQAWITTITAVLLLAISIGILTVVPPDKPILPIFTRAPTATATPTATAIATTPVVTLSPPTITIRSQDGPSVQSAIGTANAACNDGEQLLGGGYSTTYDGDAFNASYPSDSRTWSVSYYPLGGRTASATSYALCVRFERPIQVQIKQGSDAAQGTRSVATCPDGFTVIAGGFQENVSSANPLAYQSETFPSSSASSWNFLTTGVQGGKAWAICAKDYIHMRTVQTPFSAQGSGPVFANWQTSCSAGEYLVGGGFQFPTQDHATSANAPAHPPQSNPSQWYVRTTAPNGTVYGVCLTFDRTATP